MDDGCVRHTANGRARGRSRQGGRVECARVELPPLGDRVEPDALRDLSDAGLDALSAELQTTERAPERRRRERAQQVAQRAGVREAAKSGGMPSLATALESGEELFDAATV